MQALGKYQKLLNKYLGHVVFVRNDAHSWRGFIIYAHYVPEMSKGESVINLNMGQIHY